jgi:hypothetical protein
MPAIHVDGRFPIAMLRAGVALPPPGHFSSRSWPSHVSNWNVSFAPYWGAKSGLPIHSIGSAVLVEDHQESLLLTAGHVMDYDQDGYLFGVAGSDNGKLFRPTGHAFKFLPSPETLGGDWDIYDFGGIFLDWESAEQLRANFDFVKAEDIDVSLVPAGTIVALHGFPHCNSESKGDFLSSGAISALSTAISPKQLPSGGYSEEHHIFAHFNRRAGFRLALIDVLRSLIPMA